MGDHHDRWGAVDVPDGADEESPTVAVWSADEATSIKDLVPSMFAVVSHAGHVFSLACLFVSDWPHRGHFGARKVNTANTTNTNSGLTMADVVPSKVHIQDL